jgi:hypothetical protein
MTQIKNPIVVDGAEHCERAKNLAYILSILKIVRCWTKSLIIKLALCGLLPIKLADWLIQRGGLSHD